jgi:hypothetical protein
MPDTPAGTAARRPLTFWQGVVVGFVRGNVYGGVIFTWAVAPHNQYLALIGVAATFLGFAASSRVEAIRG